jgi:type IV pilus assembly protein PilB
VLIIDDMVQNMVLKKSSAHEIGQAAHQNGNFTTLKEDAADKVVKGQTTLEEAASAVLV